MTRTTPSHDSPPPALAFRPVPLSLEKVLSQRDRGFQLLDVRDPASFASGFLRGSINIPLGAGFMTWVERILPCATMVLIIGDEDRTEHALELLEKLEHVSVCGYLEGGMDPVHDIAEELDHVDQIMPEQLRTLLESSDPPRVLDVRNFSECFPPPIEGSLRIPVDELGIRRSTLPLHGPLVVVCQGGQRSMMACSLLKLLGPWPLLELRGGVRAWRFDQDGEVSDQSVASGAPLLGLRQALPCK